jgi:hypothetical protein
MIYFLIFRKFVYFDFIYLLNCEFCRLVSLKTQECPKFGICYSRDSRERRNKNMKFAVFTASHPRKMSVLNFDKWTKDAPLQILIGWFQETRRNKNLYSSITKKASEFQHRSSQLSVNTTG